MTESTARATTPQEWEDHALSLTPGTRVRVLDVHGRTYRGTVTPDDTGDHLDAGSVRVRVEGDDGSGLWMPIHLVHHAPDRTAEARPVHGGTDTRHAVRALQQRAAGTVSLLMHMALPPARWTIARMAPEHVAHYAEGRNPSLTGDLDTPAELEEWAGAWGAEAVARASGALCARFVAPGGLCVELLHIRGGSSDA